MQLPKYALLDIGDFSPSIIMLEPPYFIVTPYRVRQDNKEELDDIDMKMANGEPIVKVPGYSIFLSIRRSLKPNDIQGEERIAILREMALF